VEAILYEVYIYKESDGVHETKEKKKEKAILFSHDFFHSLFRNYICE